MKPMKNLILALTVVAFVSCASEKTDSNDAEKDITKTEKNEISTNETTIKENKVNTGKRVIDSFLNMLDGTEETAEKAVKKYAVEKVIANKMIPYGKNPKIDSQDGNCCIFSLSDDEDINQYQLCEENGKITVFDIYWEGVE